LQTAQRQTELLQQQNRASQYIVLEVTLGQILGFQTASLKTEVPTRALPIDPQRVLGAGRASE